MFGVGVCQFFRVPLEGAAVIVAEADPGFQFVTQVDHAALAGQFADHWGNDTFERPDPPSSVVIAAYTHDDGWWQYDRRPHRCGDGTPETFTEIAPERWIALYDDGIDAVIKLDRYAGLLVSMHGVGLRRRRYGLSPSWPPTPSVFTDFVDRQESRQLTLARELLDDNTGEVTLADLELLSALHASGSPPDETSSHLWRNYCLLQAWDTLSLTFCTTVSPPKYDKIGPIISDETESERTLAIESVDSDSVIVSPYPFDVEPLAVSVPIRRVRDEAFDEGSELTRAYYDAPCEVQEFTLRRAER